MDYFTQHLARKNLHHLWWLRNIAIVCEAVILAVAVFVLHLPLPVNALITIILVQLAVNVLVWWRLHTAEVVREWWLLSPLLVDVTALFALLALSGGASNPFTSLFILQVILAATLLPAAYTWLVTGLAITYYSLLIPFWQGADSSAAHSHHGAHSLHSAGAESTSAFDLHIYGMWGSFVILALLVAWFVTRMQTIIRRQNHLLAASEQLAVLGTMATSAAHELGTPLSSIALLAH